MDKERAKRRSARRQRLDSLRQRRRRTTQASSAGREVKKSENRPRGRMPGRFSGVLLAATVFFIILQGAVPARELTTINSIVGAGFFLLFAYFMVLWLLRRGVARAQVFSLLGGVALAAGVELAKFLQPGYSPDLIMLALVLPALLIGTFLGRLVFVNTPA